MCLWCHRWWDWVTRGWRVPGTALAWRWSVHSPLVSAWRSAGGVTSTCPVRSSCLKNTRVWCCSVPGSWWTSTGCQWPKPVRSPSWPAHCCTLLVFLGFFSLCCWCWTLFLLLFLAGKYDIKPEDILLIHDELDKPLGKMSIKLGGSARLFSFFDIMISTLFHSCQCSFVVFIRFVTDFQVQKVKLPNFDWHVAAFTEVIMESAPASTVSRLM